LISVNALLWKSIKVLTVSKKRPKGDNYDQLASKLVGVQTPQNARTESR
jgi:hypothetical protein